MTIRRAWLRGASTAAVSAAALTALAAPADATESAPQATPATAAAAGPVDYATWQRDCQAVMDQALPHLRQRIADARPGERQAIVFDIDNTTLETDFGFHYPQPANRPVLDVARYAQEHGVALFFVTAAPASSTRPPSSTWSTTATRSPDCASEACSTSSRTSPPTRPPSAPRSRARATRSSPTSATAPPTSPAATPRRRSSSRTTTDSCPETSAAAGAVRTCRRGPVLESTGPLQWPLTLTRPCSGSVRRRRPPARSAGRRAAPTCPRRGR